MTIETLVVELVAPALVGGPEKGRSDDPPTLRPPSLRGQLRFWSRALGGESLETELWGDADGGQRVKLLPARPLKKVALQTYALLPHKSRAQRSVMKMIPPGTRFLLRFALPPGIDRRRLQAVVWTWLHLGGIGRRARRGYGSCLWLPAEGDLLADLDLPLRPWPGRVLASADALAEHLRTGFAWVYQVFEAPGTDPRSDGQDEERLATIDQIFVGRAEGRWLPETHPPPGAEALQARIKGLSSTSRGSTPDAGQLGSGHPRRPSPMVWRLFPATRDTSWTVLTWFPAGLGDNPPLLQTSSGTYNYLHDDLGFQESLAGGPLAGAPSQAEHREE